MKGARTLALMFAYICILGVAPAGAAAQEFPGRVANTGVASIAAVGEAQLFDGHSDILFGKNTRGPYALSWKPIDKTSERIAVNRRAMQRGLDYDIDYASGALTFTEPVPGSAVIRAEYTFDPATAVRNTAPLSLPITLDLLKKQNKSLQFTALYKQPDPNAQAGADLTVFGLTGQTKTKEGEISSLLLVSSTSPGRDPQDRASLIDRSAMQFGTSTGTDTVQLSAFYSRVGEQFTGAKEYKLKPASEAVDVAATYRPSDKLSLSSSVKRTEALGGAKKGEVTTTSSHSVVLSPDNAPKLTVSRTEVGKDKPEAAGRKTTTDKIELEHRLTPNIGAVATHQDVVSRVGDTSSRVTTNQLAVDARPSENVSIKSRVTRQESSRRGEETGVSLDIDAAPTKSISLKAAVSRSDTEAAGRDTREAVKLIAVPTSNLSVEMSLAHRDSEAKGDELGHSVKVVSAPSSNLKLQMSWAERDSEIRGDEQVGEFQLETSPVKAVTLSAAVGMRDTGLSRDLTREARLEVRPFGHTTLGGGYKEVETNGAVASRITDVSASTKPVGFLDLSGRYRLRQAVGQEDLDTVDLAAVLDTGGIFKFTGSYVSNPEDKKGVVQRVNNQRIGLVSDLGRLKLRGGLTFKDDYLLGKRSEVTEVALDYRLSSHSLLTTSYKLDEYREQAALETSVYSLGYTHRIRSDFHLYLGGSMTMYEKDRALLEDQTEYEAEASLGIRF